MGQSWELFCAFSLGGYSGRECQRLLGAEREYTRDNNQQGKRNWEPTATKGQRGRGRPGEEADQVTKTKDPPTQLLSPSLSIALPTLKAASAVSSLEGLQLLQVRGSYC